MLDPEPNEVGAEAGTVLIVSDVDSAERLARWVRSAGERPVTLTGAEMFLAQQGDDENIDLVVTELDTEEPDALRLLDRLLTQELFPGIPRLHLLRDPALRERIQHADPQSGWIAMASPPEASAFKARVHLAARLGRLGRRLGRSSVNDPLTGAFNRGFLLHRLQQEFSRARRYRTPLSLVLFDVEEMRRINEQFGQAEGDQALRGASQALRGEMRKEDLFGRIGGTSFGAILAGTGFRGAATFANKVCKAVHEFPPPGGNDAAPMRLSAGVCSYQHNQEIDSAEALLLKSEQALAEAKRRGGNRVFISEDLLRGERRLVLIADSDVTLLGLTQELFALEDYQVLTARTAGQVLELTQIHHPHLLIVSMELARTDIGPNLFERLRDSLPDPRPPIIAMSADAETGIPPLSRLGIDRFVTKPFSLNVLPALARELIETYRPL